MKHKSQTQRISYEKIVEDVDDLISEFGNLNFIVRDIDLQKELRERAQNYLQHIKSYKKQAADQKIEKMANKFFEIQCILNAVVSTLQLWINIKTDQLQSAWDCLIDAQEYVNYALKANAEHPLFIDFKERLQNIETVTFPPFGLYNSVGLAFTGGECSVCGQPLSSCEHIEEKIYYGVVCKRVNIENVALNHVALVKSPKDRRCIVTEFEFEEGKIFDYISRKFLREEDKEGGAKATARLLSTKTLDVF